MAKISEEAREIYNKKTETYRERINKSLEKEKNIQEIIRKDSSGTAYKKLLLCDEMIYVSTLYMVMNALSLKILAFKSNDALNDARKSLYKAIIYLEEIVSSGLDIPYTDLEDRLSEISNTPLEKRYYQIRKLGLAIRMLTDAFGENSKWKWSFVELEGRFAIVAKNMIDMKIAMKNYFDPRSLDYDTTVYCLRLIKSLLEKSASAYRDRYELTTRRLDDISMAIHFLLAQRRLCQMIGNVDEAEEIRKRAIVWREKMEADHKAGTSQ